jgi:hypothetical protein
MDFEDAKEAISHHRNLIRNHQRHIRVLEEQKSTQGSLAPSGITIQIEEYQKNIRDGENKIAELRKPFIKLKQEELDAFKAMLQVLSNPSARRWVLSRAADLTIGIIGQDVKVYEDMLYIIDKEIKSMCSEHIERLSNDIREIENL